MSRRIDYYDDPAAPQANSLVPSVNVVVVNGAGDVLMIRRSDNDNWAVPGDHDNPWDDRQPFSPTEETELEPVPGHYKHMLGLPV